MTKRNDYLALLEARDELQRKHDALRLSRDLAREQLSATIAERAAERRLSDALAEAVCYALGPAMSSSAMTDDARYQAARAALSRYDGARGAR